MTSTRAINAAAGVIHAAMQQGKTLPQTIAYALDSAGLLNSPEIAAELEHLRKRVAELEAAVPQKTSYVIEMSGMLSPLSTLRHASLEAAREPVMKYLAVHPGTPYRIVRWDETSTVVESGGEPTEALHASSGAVIETTTEPSVEPNGCSRCGIPKDKHGRQWTLSAGWHPWNPPTDEQIKERMLRRRSVNELRALLAGQREDAYRSPLHHDYAVPHDLPDVTS